MPPNEWTVLVDQVLTASALFPVAGPGVPSALPVTGNTQGSELKEILCSVPSVPDVPGTFEEARYGHTSQHQEQEHKNPVGGEVAGEPAPYQSRANGLCKTCVHLARPGKSEGYCGGRSDLPPAYGPLHPLRRLPTSALFDCSTYERGPL
jgi:hypothetical protein